jgi:M6 family metalloprotease-like protein
VTTFSRWMPARWASLATLAMIIVFALPAVANALEPPRPGELERYAQDGTLDARQARAAALGNDELAPGVTEYLETQAFKASAGARGPLAAPPLAWRGMPTTGNVKILALLIDFSNWPGANVPATISSKLFGGGTDATQYPYESLRNYYSRSSYSQLNISGDVLGWYHTGYPRSTVSQTRTGRENLIRDALQWYDSQGVDFTQYDNDGDGAIDYFIVIWTGPDNGWSGFWWGYQTYFQNTGVVLDGKTLGTYSWQWESVYQNGSTSGEYDQTVVIHETGHALGLPDYYDYDPSVGPDGGVGGLDMMDANWGDHNPFSKWILGWLTPQVMTGGSAPVTVSASGTNPSALAMMSDASASDPFKEFFLVQNRRRVGNDSDCVAWSYQDMPNDGLLVWHLDARLNSYGDDYRYDNSYTSHKLLRLMEADGFEEIQKYGAWANAGDYYGSGATFDDTTAPNSKRYDYSPSGVTVYGIPLPGQTMTFNAAISGDMGPDVNGPMTFAAYRSTVRKGGIATLKYRVLDDWSPKCAVTIKIKTLGGSTVKTLRLGTKVCGPWLAAKFRCNLARKTYRFYVNAVDAAGNLQTTQGSNRLIVR